MGFTTSKGGEGFQRDLVPEGNHRACIVAVIYLGAHIEQKFKSTETQRNEKVDVVYELLDEEHEPPWVIGRMYTASTFEKAALSKVCAAALGRPLKKDEEVDVETLVGRAVMIEVEHTTKNGVTYDGVGDVTPVASVLRKMPVKPKYQPFYADPDTYVDHTWVPYIFGKKVSEKIAERVKDDPARMAAAQQACDYVNAAVKAAGGFPPDEGEAF